VNQGHAVKIAVLDLWRENDEADFRSVLPELRAQGLDVVDLYVKPHKFADSNQWIDAMLAKLDEVTTRETGGVRLLGFCAGGRVAMAIAARLEARGTPATYLGLIETWQRSPLVELDRALYSRYAVGFKLMFHQHLQWLLFAVNSSPRALVNSFARNWRSLVNRRAILRRSQEKDAPNGAWLVMNFTHATAISTVTTPAHLFNTRDSVAEHCGDPSMALAPYLRGGFHVHYVEGDHRSFTKEPQRSGLVSQIVSSIEGSNSPHG
jgi:thioesterase domain-containing protein